MRQWPKIPLPSGLKNISRAFAQAIFLFVTLAHAQGGSHAPRAIVRLPHLTIVVHEDIDPDVLRSLAKPNVTLWLKTRSNTLKDSTIERLSDFEQVYIQIRSPLSAVDAAVFRKIPRAGLWINSVEPVALSRRVPGPRPLAVEVAGALTEMSAKQVSGHRPTLVLWKPPSDLDVDDAMIDRLSKLPGRKLLQAASWPVPNAGCSQSNSHTSLQLPVAAYNLELLANTSCFALRRWLIEVGTAVDTIDVLLSVDRHAELVFDLTIQNSSIDELRSMIDHLRAAVGR